MKKKLIKVGNSYAITIPKSFLQDAALSYGQPLEVDIDSDSEVITIRKSTATKGKDNITPEFVDWLDKFNKKYKHVLTELAKK